MLQSDNDKIIVTISIIFLLWLLQMIVQVYLKLTCGRCTCNTYLNGKTVLITGANSGLGYQTALVLAGRGCRLIIADKDNCEQTRRKIIDETGNSNIIIKYFDLTSLNTIRKLAKEINESEERLDILINNAGVGNLENAYTEDGLHKGTQINHFGPFLLTHLLLGLLKKSAPSRVIFVSSWLAFANNLTPENLNNTKNTLATYWSDMIIYGNSKLCNIITAKELSRKLQGTNVTVTSLHPGLVHTPIFLTYANSRSVNIVMKWLFDIFLKHFAKNVEEGAQTTVHLALSRKTETGKFYADCKICLEPYKARDPAFVEAIWKASEVSVDLAAEELI